MSGCTHRKVKVKTDRLKRLGILFVAFEIRESCALIPTEHSHRKIRKSRKMSIFVSPAFGAISISVRPRFCSPLLSEVSPNRRDDHEKGSFLDGILRGAARFVRAEHAGAGLGFSDLVSGVGDDANPCSWAAPCKTFAGYFTVNGTQPPTA